MQTLSYEMLPKPIEQIQCCVSVRERWACALEALHTTTEYIQLNKFNHEKRY